ncbi:hypothetical protein HWV62_1160 [Athelia sp. TMB]|nr:hypothetical protein HWV62_1160 [Athelia sp. TMB]
MTGRIVMSSYESLRAAGTNVICLSPWGDSSPLFLPCIRFRDLAVHMVIAGTGGMAAVAAPVMGPISVSVYTQSRRRDTILVEVGLHAGFEASTEAANDLIIGHGVSAVIPLHSARLESNGVKVILITLKYKHTMEDASLGFYRSSVHKDNSLFATVKDYLAVEKGWFSPYLFASGRRPIIPRSMKPDVIFCHGPFLSGDYKIGERLLAESASSIILAAPPPPDTATPVVPEEAHHFTLSLPDIPKLTMFSRSRTPSPEPQLAAVPPPPSPRRIVIMVLGLRPHRVGVWTSSHRPNESVINYILLSGAPAIVVPAKLGAPLLAWDSLTLEEIWKIELPPDGAASSTGQFEGVVNVLYEYLDMCVDWDRVVIPAAPPSQDPEVSAASTDPVHDAKKLVKSALGVLLAAAVRSGASKEVKKEVDKERSGIAMWRIP